MRIECVKDPSTLAVLIICNKISSTNALDESSYKVFLAVSTCFVNSQYANHYMIFTFVFKSVIEKLSVKLVLWKFQKGMHCCLKFRQDSRKIFSEEMTFVQSMKI